MSNIKERPELALFHLESLSAAQTADPTPAGAATNHRTVSTTVFSSHHHTLTDWLTDWLHWLESEGDNNWNIFLVSLWSDLSIIIWLMTYIKSVEYENQNRKCRHSQSDCNPYRNIGFLFSQTQCSFSKSQEDDDDHNLNVFQVNKKNHVLNHSPNLKVESDRRGWSRGRTFLCF